MINGEEKELFHLEIDVKRADVVEWLQSVPGDRLAEEVENTLAAGNLVLSLLQASAGEESMRRFFRPVAEKMDDLKDIIDRMLTSAHKSQKLGELGESVVSEQLKRAFPADNFEVVSREEHQADLKANFTVDDGKAREARIEVKLYSDDVPADQVKKFYYDLGKQNTRYGLMVSLTSRISGISGPVHLEHSKDRVIVYVPNAGMDGFGVLWGATVLKSIILYEARVGATGEIPGWAIEEAWQRLSEEINALKEISGEMRSMRESLRSARQAVLMNLDQVAETALSAETRLQYCVERIANKLTDELQALPQKGAPAALPPPAEEDAILAFIEKLRTEGDKKLQAFEAVHDLCKERSIDVSIAEDGENWLFGKGGNRIGHTKTTKTRMDLCLDKEVESGQCISFVPSSEQFKGDQVIINGKDIQVLVERAKAWLA